MDNEALQEPEDITNDMPTDISWEELEHMTDGFSDECKIGSGGYGVVYKGVRENGKNIAVKKFYDMPGLDEKQFQNEIKILARLEHQNIVRLIGQCYKEQERCVEYKGNLVWAKREDRVICLEYLHNGSLEEHLSDESSGLPWHKRYQIIKGICEGLNYLHEHSIFHLDLKPGNILLDDNMLPKIADFGLSRLFSGTRKSHTTTHLIGTPGFMPPEYIEKSKISEKYDVFSLGVIIISIMTGPNGYSRQGDMTSQDFIELVHGNWMTRLHKLESGDASYLDAHSNEVQNCITIALNCLEPDRHKRPSIGDIIHRLNESETTTGELNKQLVAVHTLGETETTTDFLVGFTRSVMEGVLIKAKSFITEDFMLRQSARRDLEFIIGEFEMMHSILNVANQERANHYVFRTWVKQIRDLSYDVEDCIDFVPHQDFSTTWLRRMVPSFLAAAPLPLDEAVIEIQQLKAKVADVSMRISRYSLISESGSNPVMQRQSPTSHAIGATPLHIFTSARDTQKKQKDLGDLMQLITMGNSDLGVISVSGTGADLGRASIIKEVYQDPQVCRDFGCRGWIKLTYPFSLHDFLQSLVIQFYTNACLDQGTIVDVAQLKRMERSDAKQGKMIEELVKQVDGKKFLLVLENVCTMAEWDAIRGCLPYSKTGNWIIVSTDQLEIARLCIGHSYQVLEIKEYSADAEYPVYVFFKEGPQGKETGRVMSSNNEILMEDEVNHGGGLTSYHRIPTSRKVVASSWFDQFSLVGRELQMNELRNYQTAARFNDWEVMSVWGIAGVGKSVLVRNLYYERMLQKDPIFDKYGWVLVSHPFNLRDFSRSLLLDFHSEPIEDLGIEDPILECHKLLKEHPCLVVIDDVQSTEEWDLIQRSMVSRHSKSVIIVITTEESIATYCADNEEVVFNVKGLEAEASFDLFRKEVQNKNQASPLKNSDDKELEQLIVKCGRLPKVIVAVAKFLAPKTVTCMESTRTLNRRFMHELESNPEFGGLRDLFVWMHSYFRTCPDFLRPCIFYMSIFPGSQIIRRRRLVMRWVAEGYSRDTKDTTAEEKGEILFSMLVNLSMIQPPMCKAITHMRMIQCQVSAFFHEYIISRPDEENIIFALEVFALKGRCLPTTRRTGRHLVIESSWDRDRIVFESIDFSRLRSLTVFGEWESFFISKSMKVLRVLDLENATGVTDKDLELMVKLLPRLKFLSLRGSSGINHLPSSLGELRQLETLDVRHTSIVTLPASIIKLKKLQYIRAGTTFPWRSHQLVGVEVPIGIDKLTALHTLGVVNAGPAGGKASLRALKKITQLRKLGVFSVNKKNCAEFCAAIACHVRLESLSVWLSNGNEECLDNISLHLKKPLKKTQGKPLENLQSLKLCGLVKQVPSWIKDLPKLTKLELEITMSEEVEVINVLGEIKELSILRLSVKPHHGADGKLDFCVCVNGIQQHCYLKLKILEITCSSKLNVSFGSEAMQNLELLTARCCSGSTLKFIEVKNLSKLKLKEVWLCGSHDNTLKDDMERQLNEHPRKPPLKIEELDVC